MRRRPRACRHGGCVVWVAVETVKKSIHAPKATYPPRRPGALSSTITWPPWRLSSPMRSQLGQPLNDIHLIPLSIEDNCIVVARNLLRRKLDAAALGEDLIDGDT